MTSVVNRDAAVEIGEGEARPAWTLWLRKVLAADFSPAPVVVSLVLIAVVFETLNSRFLSPENLANLVAQMVSLGFLAAGVVVILLIGEIDLSVGIVSGFTAAVMAVLNTEHGWPAWAAMAAAVAAGAGIGVVNGFFVTRFHLPSFVVTLAGLIAWQGALYGVLGDSGSVNITDPRIVDLAGQYLSKTTGFIIATVIAVVHFAGRMLRRRRRARQGLTTGRLLTSVLVSLLLLIVLCAGVAVLNRARGVSLALVILVVVLVTLDSMTRRRKVGRHIFAIGGNVEAARRGGIRVRRVRIAVFALGSGLAAVSGIFASSRLLSVSTSSGGSDILLNAIAAAVIGGTSLFGGRGSVWAALLGALVIGGISNGMDLLSFGSATKFLITGAVLLVAVTVDATLRNRYRPNLD